MLDLVTESAPTFIDQLSEPVREQVSKAGTLVRYQSGQLIHNRGDEKPGVSIVVSGAVQVGAFGEDGTFTMTSHLGIGQTFGEFTTFVSLPRSHDVIALGETEINQLSAPAFQRLYDQYPEVSHALLTTSLMRTQRLFDLFDAIRRLPLRERTAKVLLMLMQSAGDRDAFECRQSDLAHALGVSRSSLSKALQQLKELGFIDTGYGRIKLIASNEMRRWVMINCAY